MGRRFELKCSKCKRRYNATTGSGFSQKESAKALRKEIREGKYGQKLKQEMMAHKDLLPDPTWHVYSCQCGYWESSQSMHFIRFAERKKEEDLYKEWETVKKHFHICPKCGRRMKIVDDNLVNLVFGINGLLPCPSCGEKMELIDMVHWD